MDADNTFKKSDWIDKGRKWADTPPDLKNAVQWFFIPEVLKHDILPSPFLLITEVLEYPIPLENTVIAPQPAQYFSKSVLDITSEALILRVRFRIVNLT
jgi:hypothetical protein